MFMCKRCIELNISIFTKGQKETKETQQYVAIKTVEKIETFWDPFGEHEHDILSYSML